MTELDKMAKGLPFDPSAQEIRELRAKASQLCHEFNELKLVQHPVMQEYYKKILPNVENVFWVVPPFRCELGTNIYAGCRFVGNYDMHITDFAPVTFGDRVYIGPRCTIDTRVVPRTVRELKSGLVTARPVRIGDSVWFGSEVTVCAGVTIGNGCVIGAGSVVTEDIPGMTFAAGNPARVIRSLDIDEQLWR